MCFRDHLAFVPIFAGFVAACTVPLVYRMTPPPTCPHCSGEGPPAPLTYFLVTYVFPLREFGT